MIELLESSYMDLIKFMSMNFTMINSLQMIMIKRVRFQFTIKSFLVMIINLNKYFLLHFLITIFLLQIIKLILGHFLRQLYYQYKQIIFQIYEIRIRMIFQLVYHQISLIFFSHHLLLKKNFSLLINFNCEINLHLMHSQIFN